jgi:hypothetical protein
MTSVVRVILYRDPYGTTPWGFRLQGGNDVGGPLIIQRVFLGSPSEGELHRGDVIVRIGNHDSTRYSHHEAQMAIKNATNHLDLTVLRRGGGVQTPSPTPVPSAAYHAPHLGSYLPQTDLRRFKPPPPQNNPQAQHDDIDFDKQIERELISHQPHRTLPLITPAIKVKHDLPTGSYLRHVHDPYAKGSRQEHAMKTRVHDSILNAGAALSTGSSPARSATPEVIGQVGPNSHLVHRQYNSPINLYSAQNVADTIAGQTGVTPLFIDLSFLKTLKRN